MYDYYDQPISIKRDVAVAASCHHTVLSGRRNWVSPDLGLMRVIVLPWSVSGAVHQPSDYGDKIMVLSGLAPRGFAHKHRAGAAIKWQHPLKSGQQCVRREAQV